MAPEPLFVASPGINSASHSTSARAMEARKSLRICTTSLGSIPNLACIFRSVGGTTPTWSHVRKKPQPSLLREHPTDGRHSEIGDASRSGVGLRADRGLSSL